MGKPRKQNRKKRFNYDVNRKKKWSKQRKLPQIDCKQIKKAWDKRKSLVKNMSEMGLSADANKTLKIPRTKDTIVKSLSEDNVVTERTPPKVRKDQVVKELEAEANVEQPHTLRLSEPDVRYCIYMLDKYGEDYKAMARDSRNYYQDTPKQIKKKINVFKSIPDQYNAYLKSKTDITVTYADVLLSNNGVTPVKSSLSMAANTRKATRSYRARRRNGNYGSSPVTTLKTTKQTSSVPIYQVRRKLQFGRPPPKPRPNVSKKLTASPTKSKKLKQNKSRPIKTKISQRLQHRKISRELYDLLHMSSCYILPNRLRSSPKCSNHCHGDSSLPPFIGYRLHSSPEHLNLSRIE